jgi:predicted ATPase with chaperone activity
LTSFGKKKVKAVLLNPMVQLNLSAPAYNKILHVVRTFAGLQHSAGVKGDHIAEAIQ